MNVEGKKLDVNEDVAENAFGYEEEIKVDKKKNKKEILANTVLGFLFATFGYCLGGLVLPFGAQMLGIAFICVADKRVPYILLGVCLSAILSETPIVLIAAYLAVVMIRILVRLTIDTPWRDSKESGERAISDILPEIFSENICLRMSTACVGSFILGMYNLIEGGFLYYDLYGAIIGMVAAPIVVLLCYGIFRRSKEESTFYYISMAILAFGVSFSARELTVYGVSVAAFGVMFATLYFCRRKGMLFGIATAVICGLAYSPMHTPAFIFAAIAAGALWRVSAFFASVCAFTATMAWGFYVSGIGAITSLMPATLSSSLMFGVLDKLFFSTEKDRAIESEATVEKRVCVADATGLSDVRLDATEQKIKMLCETFNSMSKFFYELADRMKRPLAGDIKQICDSAFDACCGNCKNKEICWEENYTETLSAVASISAYVHKDGRITSESVPRLMRERCERLPDIIDEINYNSEIHTKQLLLCDKTEIFALDYDAVAELLASSVSVDDEEYEEISELGERLCLALTEADLGVDSAVVYGKRKRNVLLSSKDASAFQKNKNSIIDIAEGCCGALLEEKGIVSDEAGRTYMLLSEKRKVYAEFAKRSVMSGNEEDFCGDTVCIFENSGDNKFYSLISDGMGSGRDAALTSGICAMFLQKMLSTSNSCHSSLKLLNGFLRNKGGGSLHECSATVDLLELDLILGRASFYKSGAAPTYVFRDGSLFKLRSKTVPVGIIRELDSKKTSFDVGDGDVIVMVSDGVTQGKDECPWLFELLKKNVECEGIERTADLIVERARRENGNDDISVVVIKVRRDK